MVKLGFPIDPLIKSGLTMSEFLEPDCQAIKPDYLFQTKNR